MAAYEQLKKEYYIGALYFDTPPSSAEEAHTVAGAKRMTIRISAERWSTRSFSQLWKQGIAINNTPPSVELTNDLLAFSNILKGHLTWGDQLVITKEGSGKKVNVTLNGVQLMTSSQEKFFDYLLNVWIGARPPSSEFKENILNTSGTETDASLVEHFTILTASPERRDAVAKWIKEEPPPRRQPIAKPTPVASIPTIVKKPTTANIKNTGKTARKFKASTVAFNDVRLQKGAKDPTEQDQKQVNINNIHANYRWGVLEKIYGSIEYPEWANQFEQTGTVSLILSINSDGSLKSIIDKSGNTSRILVNEVRNSVKKQSPFNPIPKALSTDSLDIAFNITFNEGGGLSPLPPKPQIVQNARQQSSTNEVQAQYTEYTNAIIALVRENIEYPAWSREFKQEGKVAVVVTIDKYGKLIDIKKRVKGRHHLLIQELEDTITRLQPFAPIPPELNMNTMTIDIEHEFSL